MKTRQIQTRYWDDEFILEATWQSRYVYIYILTNPAINLVGIFQLNDKKIALETGLLEEDIEIAKEELAENKKVLFFSGWVYVINSFKNNRYWISPKNWEAWEREFSKINKNIIGYFESVLDTSIYSSQKAEIDNSNQAAANPNPNPNPETGEERKIHKWEQYKIDHPEKFKY